MTGLVHRREPPVSDHVAVDADAQAPAEIWQTIATDERFQAALTEAFRGLLAGESYHERARTLREHGVTALKGGYATVVAGLDRGRETEAFEAAVELTAGIGQDGMTVLGHAPLTAVADGPAALLEAADVAPTIAVRLGQDFRSRDRRERERTCRLLAMLGEVCEVAICAAVRHGAGKTDDDRGPTTSRASESHCLERSPSGSTLQHGSAPSTGSGRPIGIYTTIRSAVGSAAVQGSLIESYASAATVPSSCRPMAIHCPFPQWTPICRQSSSDTACLSRRPDK